MATEKGLFRDDTDRFTAAHQEICFWFVQNARQFVRRFFFDRPLGPVKVTLEHLIAHNRFIIGFVDVLLEYETDIGAKECALVEVKTRLSDWGACLRQLRAYREFLPQVTKTCVIHSDDRYEFCSDTDGELREYFSSQGVYVADFNLGLFNANYCALPSGRRRVRIEHAEPHGYDFNITLRGMGFDDRGEDTEVQSWIFGGLDEIRPYCEFMGIDASPWYFDWSLRPFREVIDTEVFADVVHFPSTSAFGTSALAEENLVALHSIDLKRTLRVADWLPPV